MENLLIAKVSKPQGIKGELKCQLFTDVLVAVTKAKKVIIEGNECDVQYAKVRNGDLYLKLLGINDRNNAEIFRNCEIYLPKNEIESEKTEDFLVHDLLGMVLYDQQGKQVGQIVDYEDYGSAAILSIDDGGHVYEVPYIAEVFITDGDKLVVNRKAYEESRI